MAIAPRFAPRRHRFTKVFEWAFPRVLYAPSTSAPAVRWLGVSSSNSIAKTMRWSYAGKGPKCAMAPQPAMGSMSPLVEGGGSSDTRTLPCSIGSSSMGEVRRANRSFRRSISACRAEKKVSYGSASRTVRCKDSPFADMVRERAKITRTAVESSDNRSMNTDTEVWSELRASPPISSAILSLPDPDAVMNPEVASA